MTEREQWLGLTVEAALDPELPICDPHHHLWEYPGSRYLLEEFRADLAGGHNVASTVFVECLQFYRDSGPEALRPVGETEHVHQLAAGAEPAQPRIAAGIVGFADLALGARVREVLEAHLEASPRFRGIRHATAWHASEQVHNAHTRPAEGLLLDARFREGFAVLVELGLCFDAWIYHPQVPELIDLANAFPQATLILDHMAGPLGIGPFAGDRQAVRNEWARQMDELARCENVLVKLGGRAMTNAGFGWHKRNRPPGSAELAEAMQPYIEHCIQAFGPERCMFESNFPVDRASCSYTVLWNAFKRLGRAYGAAERAALFKGTAERAYRLLH
ncbi:MAG: amidohydrolase family protein [Xanthomonadales bacterium]|nr:amidohydrolase family protein [Xanthomonadales bacterium]NIN58686.1 amidohydrolase family protein [Xanthomonadales bacterium]NIN74536.1 amidohydrolase family protein [Xanthomonadales bacterium]NIO14841.1 amidohydrolase family protein [Xanthomonadales bacterium]NIP11079.1 amidohydrolase family protein [Xanthomonadales bacterium]